jgi:acyl carrier protein phosphodiesterase
MNYLAHLFLSQHHEEIMLGNFIADFVRKTTWQQFPPAMQQGVFLHHEIDTFTDTHPVVQTSVQRLRPAFQKYSPVVIDVFYDHFLSIHWNKFTDQKLSDFCQEVYVVLEKYTTYLPIVMQEYLPEMIARNWLFYYKDEIGVRRALQNLSRRSSHRKDLETALNNLHQDYDLYEKDFLLFFPDLLLKCNTILDDFKLK